MGGGGGGSSYCEWTKSNSHHLETRRNHCLLVFTGEAAFQGFLGGAGFRPSTVAPHPRRLAACASKSDSEAGCVFHFGAPLNRPPQKMAPRKRSFPGARAPSSRSPSAIAEDPRAVAPRAAQGGGPEVLDEAVQPPQRPAVLRRLPFRIPLRDLVGDWGPSDAEKSTRYALRDVVGHWG